MTVPTIACLLLGGAISDRFDRRRIMLYSDLGRGLAVGLLAALRSRARSELRNAGGDRRGLRNRRRVFHTGVRVDRAGDRRPEPTRPGKRTRPVRPPDLPSPRRACARRFARRVTRRQAQRSRWTPRSFVVSAAAVFAMQSDRRAPSVRRARPSPPSPTDCGSFGATCGCGGRLLSAAVAYLAFLGPTETLLPFLVKNTSTARQRPRPRVRSGRHRRHRRGRRDGPARPTAARITFMYVAGRSRRSRWSATASAGRSRS